MKFHSVVLGVLEFVLVVSPAISKSGIGQVILQNETSRSYDLWVDGKYACTALPHIECLAATATGNHMLTVQQGTRIIYNTTFELADGGIYTYPVTQPLQ